MTRGVAVARYSEATLSLRQVLMQLQFIKLFIFVIQALCLKSKVLALTFY